MQFALASLAPVRFTSTNVALSQFAPVRSTPDRLQSTIFDAFRVQSRKFKPDSSAFVNWIPVRSLGSITSEKVAPERVINLNWSR